MSEVIKVKVWGKYRRAQVLAVGTKRVRVRILAYELCQGLTDLWTLDLSEIRKADLPLIESLRKEYSTLDR